MSLPAGAAGAAARYSLPATEGPTAWETCRFCTKSQSSMSSASVSHDAGKSFYCIFVFWTVSSSFPKSERKWFPGGNLAACPMFSYQMKTLRLRSLYVIFVNTKQIISTVFEFIYPTNLFALHRYIRRSQQLCAKFHSLFSFYDWGLYRWSQSA